MRPGHVPPTFPRRPNLYRWRPRCAQVPAYLAKQSELKAKGISEVVVYCVNDMAVMEAWAKDQVRLGAHPPPAARPTFSPSCDGPLAATFRTPLPTVTPPRCRRLAARASSVMAPSTALTAPCYRLAPSRMIEPSSLIVSPRRPPPHPLFFFRASRAA